MVVLTNLLALIHVAMRGAGFRTHGPLLMLKTAARSVRFSDVAVYARGTLPIASDGDRDLMANPVLAVHVRTMDSTERGRLVSEYQATASVQAILLVDHVSEKVRLIQRTAAGAWLDERVGEDSDVVISSLNLTIPHADIFARD